MQELLATPSSEQIVSENCYSLAMSVMGRARDGPGCCYQFVTTRGPIVCSTSCILAEHISQCILTQTSAKVVMRVEFVILVSIGVGYS